MFRPISIKIRNFAWIREDEITFPEYGLVVVNGDNRTANGKAKSIGAGKTLLGEALSRCNFGVKGRYTEFGAYSFEGKGDMYVTTEATLNGVPLTIESGYKCSELSKTGEGLRYTLEGKKPVERNHVDVTRADLSNMLGMTPLLGEWTVFVDGDNLKFHKLSQRNSVDIVMSSLNQPSWDAIHERAKETVRGMVSETNAAQQTLDKLKEELATAETDLTEAVEDLEIIIQEEKDAKAAKAPRVKELNADLDKLAKQGIASKKRKTAIEAELRNLEKTIAKEFAKGEEAILTDKSKLKKWRLARDKIVTTHAQLKADAAIIFKEQKAVASEPDVCSKCGKKWDKKHSADELSDLDSRLAEADKVCKAAAVRLDKAEDAIDELDEAIDDAELKLSDIGAKKVKALSAEFEILESNTVTLSADKQDIEDELEELTKNEKASEIEKHETIVKERKRVKRKAKDSVEDSAEELAEAGAAQQIGEYWSKAFGPTGIPNMILRDAVGPMTRVSACISERLTGGALSITYSTRKTLKSGDDKAQLIVKPVNRHGSTRIDGNSKGESGLNNLIIAETLAEVGSVPQRIGYRWYDEVINSQDPVVRHNILEYMHDYANTRKILVFLVDHHKETEGYADYVLTAVKDTKGTTFKWS